MGTGMIEGLALALHVAATEPTLVRWRGRRHYRSARKAEPQPEQGVAPYEENVTPVFVIEPGLKDATFEQKWSGISGGR
jgi:hypothetical protein